MAHNPECGLDCVSAGAVRLDNTPSADQQTGRQHLSGDQSAEQVIKPGRRCRILIEYEVDLDAVPGWGYAPADWIELAVSNVTRQSHYNTTYTVRGVSINGELVG
jgi:hypothetical protein